MPFFESIELLPDDPILSLPILFAADQRSHKVNLGIGTYKDADGKPYVMSCVKEAEALVLNKNLNKEYLPIEGDHEFIHETLKLIFGANFKSTYSKGIFAAQTVGGTAALRVGGEFLVQKTSPSIYLSNPSWPNHTVIFTRGRMALHSYPYYDESTHFLDFEGMCQGIQKIPAGSVILLHPCCHNPTGIDPTFEQWKVLSELILKQKIIPFFDFAYQGMADTMEHDAQVIQYFAEQGHEMLVAYSLSKNFSLYGERMGLLAVVTANEASTQKVGSHIKQIIRGIYSTPPLHGARIVKTILQSEVLRKKWLEELASIRLRIKEMRGALVKGLMEKTDRDWSFLAKQKGMFSFSGLNPEQAHRLINDYGIYLLSNGRINVAGLNLHNIDYVVDSIRAVCQDKK